MVAREASLQDNHDRPMAVVEEARSVGEVVQLDTLMAFRGRRTICPKLHAKLLGA